MRVLSDQEVFRLKADQVFKTSVWSSLFWFFIFFGLVAGATGGFAWQWYFHNESLWWLLGVFWIDFWFGIASWAAFRTFRAGLKPSNWLVRTGLHGVSVRFRSFQNFDHPATEPVALDFKWSELASVKALTERSAKGGDEDGATIETFRFLAIELRLSASDLETLKRTLKKDRSNFFQGFKQRAEARRVGSPRPGSHRPGKRKFISVGKVNDHPVILSDEGELKIRWNGVKPNREQAIEVFSQRIKMAASEELEIDTYEIEPDASQLEALVKKRLSLGDEFDAIRLLKEHRGFTTTEAVAYISDLK
jgi:hypothetical protein